MGSQRRTRAQWRKLVAGWAASGLSQAAYCRLHGISVASLHRWRSVFQDEDAGEGTSANQPVQWLPVTLTDEAANTPSAICVVLPEGLRIELGADFPAASLRRVLDVLRPAS